MSQVKIDLSRESVRALIYYDFKSGLNYHQCIERLTNAFGEQAPSKTTVYNWFQEFRRGRSSLQDEPREGRPRTAVV